MTYCAVLLLTLNAAVAVYDQGKADLEAHEYRRAEQEFAQAELAAPGKTNALALRAKALLHLNEFDAAERCLRGYLKLNDHSADARYLLAYTLFRENKARESLDMYTLAAQVQRPSADDFKAIGLDYVLLNDQEDARKWLERSVAENPHDAEAAYYLGRAYYVQNAFSKAEAAFEKALELDPTFVKAEDNLGLTYAAQNLPGKAEAAYRKAIAMNASAAVKSREPYINLADLLSRGGHDEEVLALLEDAERIGGANGRIQEIRGRVLLSMGKYAEAEAELRAALLAKPGDGALHFLLGRILRREGKSEEAEEEFERTKSLLASKAAEKSK